MPRHNHPSRKNGKLPRKPHFGHHDRRELELGHHGDLRKAIDQARSVRSSRGVPRRNLVPGVIALCRIGFRERPGYKTRPCIILDLCVDGALVAPLTSSRRMRRRGLPISSPSLSKSTVLEDSSCLVAWEDILEVDGRFDPDRSGLSVMDVLKHLLPRRESAVRLAGLPAG